MQSAALGDIVTFGSYPQTADGTDQTPIKWYVLQNSGTELFLVSKCILDCRRYHRDFVAITWQDCDLRQWLNTAFYNMAFTPAEQSLIKTTHCRDNGESSPDTDDNVFLLSAAEVKDLTQLDAKLTVPRCTTGTEFAGVKKPDGCKLYVYDGKISADYATENGVTTGCSWWWLRTRLGEASRAAFVGTHSSIRSYCRVNRINYGVRPALKLNLL